MLGLSSWHTPRDRLAALPQGQDSTFWGGCQRRAAKGFRQKAFALRCLMLYNKITVFCGFSGIEGGLHMETTENRVTVGARQNPLTFYLRVLLYMFMALLWRAVDPAAIWAAMRRADPLWLGVGLAMVVPLTLVTAWRSARKYSSTPASSTPTAPASWMSTAAAISPGRDCPCWCPS